MQPALNHLLNFAPPQVLRTAKFINIVFATRSTWLHTGLYRNAVARRWLAKDGRATIRRPAWDDPRLGSSQAEWSSLYIYLWIKI